jgi:flagellar hook-associated protein 1 FlgK
MQSLNVGAESLFNTRQGVDTTAHNIANAQTEGFSRQRVNLTARDPSFRRNLLIGNGAYVTSITRSHDKFIERQLVTATADKGRSDTTQKALASLEDIFSPELANSVGDELNSFFDAVNSLSNFPEELTSRTAVLEQAKNLVASFHRVDSEVLRNRTDLNENVAQLTSQVSDYLGSIANLNLRISEMEVGQANQANDLRDQRDLFLRKLSETMDVNYYEDKFGMVTVRGPGDTLLVEGKNAGSFSVRVNADRENMYDVMVNDFEGDPFRDVTDKFRSGSLKGMLDVRDDFAKNLKNENNLMAMTFANRFNEIHREGFGTKDFREVKGRNFFDPVTDLDTAAHHLAISSSIENSLDAISPASSPNSPGDNIVANRLMGIKGEKLLGKGQATLTEHFAGYVGGLGIQAARANHTKEANDILSSNVTSAREAVSGVSLDEEAANMIKWQTAFTASSKVITTVDEMLETVLNLKR